MVPVNGVCSASAGVCSVGTKINDNGQTSCGTTRTWQCQGTGGGSTPSCSYTNAACLPSPVCGSASGGTFATAPSTNLCAVGSPSAVSDLGYWSWSCTSGSSVSCTASKPATGINLTFTADATILPLNGSTILRWTPTGPVTSCTATGAWSGGKSITPNSEPIGPLTSTKTYNLTCYDAASNSVFRSVTVTLPPPAPASMSATCVAPGTSVNLLWASVSDATSYGIRLDYPGDPLPLLLQNDNYVGTFYTYSPATPGATYDAWVHAINIAGWSPAVHAPLVTCPVVPSYSCQGITPTNATMCANDDTGLSANTTRTVVTACGAPKCEYTCDTGYTNSGGACVPSASYSCQGTTPSNATMCANDDTGLSANTTRTVVTACGAPKCEYTCDAGYTNSTGVCVAATAPNITATPRTIKAGDDVTLTWNLNGNNASDCSLKANGQVIIVNLNLPSYTEKVYTRTTYYLECPTGNDWTMVDVQGYGTEN